MTDKYRLENGEGSLKMLGEVCQRKRRILIVTKKGRVPEGRKSYLSLVIDKIVRQRGSA